jgi:hypothetical protein
MVEAKAETGSAEERLVAVTQPMRYWPRKKPRQFKFGSFLGRIVVTDRRLLFLSTGGPGWDESIARLMVGGLAGVVLNRTSRSSSRPSGKRWRRRSSRRGSRASPR